MRFSKWHAHGNVYLLTDEGGLTPGRVRADVGDADGIVEVLAAEDGRAEIMIWNPDGSTAELSGNGTRIAARWLADRTGARRSASASGRARPSRGSRTATSSRSSARCTRRPERVAGLEVTPVDVGDPHAVVSGGPASCGLGPLLEAHPRFPRAHERPGRACRRAGDDVTARVGSAAWGSRVSGTGAVAVAAATHGDGDVLSTFPAATSASASTRVAQRSRRPAERAQAAPLPKSRSASLRLILLSVVSLRWPMMSAQRTWYSPAGNFFGRVPGITTLRAGTRPRCSTGSAPVTSMIGVDAVSDHAGADHGPLADEDALDDDRARADEAAVLDDHRPRARRLEHAADADAAGEVARRADLRAGADGGPGVDHRARADPRADVHVAGHHDHARLEERAVAHDARRHDAHAALCEAVA